jgi:hypothetical protein
LNTVFKESMMSLYQFAGPGLRISDSEEPVAVGENAHAFAYDAREWFADAGAMLNNVITTRPALALGAALAAGVAVGWLIKRR